MKKKLLFEENKKKKPEEAAQEKRETKVSCFLYKIIRQKFAFLKISSILKTETEKRTRKAEMQKELQRSKSSVLIHWRYAFTKFSSFLCLAGPVAMILMVAGFVVSQILYTCMMIHMDSVKYANICNARYIGPV